MVSWFSLLSFLPFVFALPLERRLDNTVCGQYDAIQAGKYSILNNLWGESSATSGSQCSTLQSVNGDTVKWYTKWDWEGGDAIKSFANVQLNEGLNQQLSAIQSMQSAWHWSQKGSGDAVADVAYDLFVSWSPGGDNAVEVMIWLAKYNTADPLSYEYDVHGEAVPLTSSIDIAGHHWNMHLGSNGYNQVYSFVPTGGSITQFSGDIYAFFKYLIDNEHLSSSLYLKTAQAGTEATRGSALFETAAYSLSIN